VQDRRDSSDVRAVLELVEAELEIVKDQMVSCDPLIFEGLQGKAQAYVGLIKLMTREPLALVKEKNG